MQHAHDTSNARATRARAVAVPTATSSEVALLFGGTATAFLLALLVLLL